MLKRNFILFTILLFTAIIETVIAGNKPNNIIITGQIINKKYGNAIINHKVVISTPDIKMGGQGYYKVIYTDNEGFYYDTIRTNLVKGSLKISTIDKNQQIVDSTVYYRFFKCTEMSLLVNLSINMPFHTNQLKARFKYVQKQGGNKYYYRFINLSTGQNIVSYQWSFGDGTVSYDKNPDHTYLSPGIYRVKLIIKSSMNGTSSTNSLSKMILIREKTLYHIGGQVFADLFPVDYGKAFLYYKDSADTFTPIDTVLFDTLGYYIFYNLPEGDYLIKAQPDKESEFYGKLCPTYYGDVLKWQQSNLCHVCSTSWDYDISLLSGEGVLTGNGAIKGNIFLVDNELKKYGLYSGANITLYLLDTIGKNMTYLYTGADGDFDFSELNLEKYKLFPEVTGVNTSEIAVELNEETPQVDSLIIELSLSGINFIIPSKKVNPRLINNLYPNPVVNSEKALLSVKLKTAQEITLTITDFTGKTISNNSLHFNSGQTKVAIPVGKLSNGIYTVSITDKEGRTDTRQLIINR